MEHGARRNVGFDDIRGTVLGRAGALRVRHAMMVRGFSCLGSGSHCCVVTHCVDYLMPVSRMAMGMAILSRQAPPPSGRGGSCFSTSGREWLRKKQP